MRFSFFLLPLLFAACSGTIKIKSHQQSQEALQRSPNANPVNCAGIDYKTRDLILELADPSNFLKTNYRKSPRYGRNIEKEADCSRFVHEVYHRVGLPFSFRSTRDLLQAPEFQLIKEEDAAPGDLMVFRGHVGIIAQDGEIISATSSQRRKRTRTPSSIRSSIRKVDKKFFKGPRYALRYQCFNENFLAEK